MTYTLDEDTRKPLVWLRGEVRTPPFSAAARHEVGFLLGLLQRGESLSMPESRPMPTIGPRVHELRVTDARVAWRVVYRLDPDAVVAANVFQKTTMTTPRRVMKERRRQLRQYDLSSEE